MPRPIPRAELLVLIKQYLEHAAPRGLSRAELLAAIGPTRTSLPSIQRALDTLRSSHDAHLRYDAKHRRWHLDAPLALPLDAPDREDLLAVLIAQAILEPLLDPELLERITKLVENLDDLARTRTSPTDLPMRRAMTSTLTLGTSIDPQILRYLLAACRRKSLRIWYASPWRAETATWHAIEPWSLRIHDGAVYLRAWAIDPQQPRTFRLAHIEAVEATGDHTAPRHPPPVDLWGDDSPAFGIDRDRPGTAVIRLRGGVARWESCTIWHPAQSDAWLEPNELLERTVAYRSCREMARRLASILDGIVSIEPRELCDEVKALVAPAAAL